MTNVQSIFGNFNEIEVKEDEGEIFDSLKDFADEWVKFLNILIIENDMDLNNVRWFSSKELIVSGMTMLMIHQELLEELIQEYKNKYGLTEIIKKTDSAFKKMVKSHNKTLKSYEHLIDFNECGKRIIGLET